MGRVTITRRYAFHSVHSLVTGVHREKRHGHQYYLEVCFAGRDVAAIDQIVEAEILPHVHGRELRGELEPATGEHLVEWVHARLNASPVGPAIVACALQETRKNRFVSAASEPTYV